MLDDEGSKRDRGIKRAADNPDNHFEMIRDFARDYLIKFVPEGDWVVSGQITKAFLERFPNMVPRDKRVMGQVMGTMHREGYFLPRGQSTRERTHKGMATEWQRTALGASFDAKPSSFFTGPSRVFRKRK